MKVVFALIWLTTHSGGTIPVKIGEYEKYSQCIEQGKALRWQRFDRGYFCVPVNAINPSKFWK